MTQPIPTALEQLLIKQIAWNGTIMPARSALNLLGAGVSNVVDNANNNSTDVTISGSGGSTTNPIRFGASTAGGQSATQPPAGSRITGVILVTIDTPFSPGATCSLGSSYSLSLIFPTGIVDSAMESPAGTVIPVFVDVAWPTMGPLVATIGGAPQVGSLSLCVPYVTSVQP